VEEFKREMKTLSIKLKEAEQRAEHAEKQVKRLQKEVDRLEGMYRSPYSPTTPIQPSPEEASLHETPEMMLSAGSDPTRSAGWLASTNARIVFIAIRILILLLSTLLSLIDFI